MLNTPTQETTCLGIRTRFHPVMKILVLQWKACKAEPFMPNEFNQSLCKWIRPCIFPRQSLRRFARRFSPSLVRTSGKVLCRNYWNDVSNSPMHSSNYLVKVLHYINTLWDYRVRFFITAQLFIAFNFVHISGLDLLNHSCLAGFQESWIKLCLTKHSIFKINSRELIFTLMFLYSFGHKCHPNHRNPSPQSSCF